MNSLAVVDPKLRCNTNTPLPLTQLVQQYAAPVGLLLERLGVLRGDVDDVRQRVWLTLSRRLAAIQPGSERAFVMSVARREAGHLRRSYRRRSEVTLLEAANFAATVPPSDELLERRQRLEQVRAVLQEMDHDLRAVLLLELEGASARDVARRLDIPVGTVKSRLRRARAEFACRRAAHVAAAHPLLGRRCALFQPPAREQPRGQLER